jgi:hypothetical protein
MKWWLELSIYLERGTCGNVVKEGSYICPPSCKMAGFFRLDFSSKQICILIDLDAVPHIPLVEVVQILHDSTTSCTSTCICMYQQHTVQNKSYWWVGASLAKDLKMWLWVMQESQLVHQSYGLTAEPWAPLETWELFLWFKACWCFLAPETFLGPRTKLAC